MAQCSSVANGGFYQIWKILKGEDLVMHIMSMRLKLSRENARGNNANTCRHTP